MEPPSEFKPNVPGLEIQCSNHWAIAPWRPVRWEPIIRYQKKTILYTVSIIHYSIDLSNTLEKQLAVIYLDFLKVLDRVDWVFIFSAISFSFVNLVTETNSFTWLRLLLPMSMILCITVAELLAIFINADDSIKGIQIGDHEIKIGNFVPWHNHFLMRL